MAAFYPIGPGYIGLGNPTIASGAGMTFLNEVEEVNFNAGIQMSFSTTALSAGAPLATSVFAMPPNPTITARLNDAAIDQLRRLVLGGFAAGTSAAITAVNTSSKTFTVATDLTTKFPVGSSFRVTGSTGNDGRYTVSAVAFSTNTTITVNEAIPNSTGDGNAVASADAEVIGLGGPVELVDPPSLVFIPASQKAQGISAPNQIWFPAALIENFDNLLFNRMQANASSNNAFNVTFRAAQRAKDQAGTVIPPHFQFAIVGKTAKVPATLGWSLPTIS